MPMKWSPQGRIWSVFSISIIYRLLIPVLALAGHTVSSPGPWQQPVGGSRAAAGGRQQAACCWGGGTWGSPVTKPTLLEEKTLWKSEGGLLVQV